MSLAARVDEYLDGKAPLAWLDSDERARVASAGFTAYHSGRLERARAIFGDLVRIEPREPCYRQALAQVLIEEHEYAAAEACLDQAIALRDSDFGPYLQRADLHSRRGNWDAAIEDFTHALRLGVDERVRYAIETAVVRLQVERERH